MTMTLQIACDSQDSDETDERSAGVFEGNVAVDLGAAAEVWSSIAGHNYCTQCAPKHRHQEMTRG